jgi:uncharacterized damage-inducible protein DinB
MEGPHEHRIGEAADRASSPRRIDPVVEAPVIHPLVAQLRFTRSEFARGLEGLGDEDARRRFEPMNCISWNVGHLAWQEQHWFLAEGVGDLFADIARDFAYGAPASTPSLAEVLEAWKAITAAVDPFLDGLGSADLLAPARRGERVLTQARGDLLQRTIYHYWYHNGENQAIRQVLGQTGLPQFVAKIDEVAPYTPDRG